MSANTTKPQEAVVPTLRYYNVAAAIDWLCKAFGFEKHLVVHADDSSVRYAELIFGNSMITLGPVEGSGLGEVMAQPADTGGTETQSCYLFVTDAAAHCDRAKAAGAEILLGIDDAHSNGRGYSCRDFEGHVWNFGTYDLWRRQLAQPAGASRRFAERGGKLRRWAMATASLIAATAAVVVLGRVPDVSDASGLGLRSNATASAGEAAARALVQPDLFAREREGTSRGFSAVSDHLSRERDAREVAVAPVIDVEHLANSSGDALARAETERALEDAQQQLARERSAREEVQRGAQEVRERLSLAERTIEAVQEQLAAERNARQTAEIATEEARQKLARERGAKDAAERALMEAHSRARHAAARRPPAHALRQYVENRGDVILSASPPSPN